MTRLKKTIVAATAVAIVFGALDGISALVRESRILGVKPGMHKKQVEALLGSGKPDISSDGVDHKWPPGREQFSYDGNPSIWYGRWEDALIVGYTNDIVSDTQRCGL